MKDDDNSNNAFFMAIQKVMTFCSTINKACCPDKSHYCNIVYRSFSRSSTALVSVTFDWYLNVLCVCISLQITQHMVNNHFTFITAGLMRL